MGACEKLHLTPTALVPLLLVGSGLLLSCEPAALPLARVARLEVSPGGEEGTLEGPALRRVLDAARCHEGGVMWKGGVPAVVVMDDGRRVGIRGLSFYGHFIRFGRDQWCEFEIADWETLWAHTGDDEGTKR